MEAYEDPVKKTDAAILKNNACEQSLECIEGIKNGISHLFADDTLIDGGIHGLLRTLNSPVKKAEPVLVPEREYEHPGIVYGSIVEESGRCRLFYKCFRQENISNKTHREKYGYGKYSVCVADSEDGIGFTRPSMASSPLPGSNIILDESIDDFCVMKDPSENCPDGERYKMLCSLDNWWGGLSSAVSQDGLKWEWKKKYAVPFFGDRCSFWYHPERRKYVAWSRNYQIKDMRVIFHAETNDFGNWNFQGGTENGCNDYLGGLPRIALEPDRMDHEKTQFYGGYAFRYGNLYFAYIEVFRMQFMRLDTELACSRDGIHWTRLCDHDVFLKNGGYGSFDACWAVPTFNAPILKNGKLLIHYNGRSTPHSSPGMTHIHPGQDGCFGVSELREDGFVSLDALGSTGYFRTKILELKDKADVLSVNCTPFCHKKSAAPMEIEVMLEDAQGEKFGCYRLTSAPEKDPVWLDIHTEQQLPKKLRMTFSMRNARLYSFRTAFRNV